MIIKQTKKMKMMKRMLGVSLGLMMMGLCFTACEKNSNTEPQPVAQNQFFELQQRSAQQSAGDDDDILEMDCFQINYPIDLRFSASSVTTVSSNAQLVGVIDSWYQNASESDECPEIVYPISVTTDDGETVTVNNDDELCELFLSCWEDFEDECDWDGEECFEINYPITLTMPDGNVITVTSDEELDIAIDDFYDANPNNHDDPVPHYPFDVTLDDGTVQTINNEDELEDLLDLCYDEYDDDDCEGDDC